MIGSQQVCRACGAVANDIGTGKVLGLVVQYAECPACGYVQTEHPHWLEQAYTEAINTSDTGILARNQVNADIVVSALSLLGGLGWRVVDAAGGYGILVRLLRDLGVDAYWSDRYCANLVARGFEYDGAGAGLVTAFEAFEHFVDPGDELDRLLAIAPNVLLSTVLIPEPTPQPGDWWYYGSEHGQHIGFFRARTLQKLAEARGKCFVTDGRAYHLITERAVSGFAWKVSLRLRKVVSMAADWRLKSKTWDDHLLLSGSKDKAE